MRHRARVTVESIIRFISHSALNLSRNSFSVKTSPGSINCAEQRGILEESRRMNLRLQHLSPGHGFWISIPTAISSSQWISSQSSHFPFSCCPHQEVLYVTRRRLLIALAFSFVSPAIQPDLSWLSMTSTARFLGTTDRSRSMSSLSIPLIISDTTE